MLKIRYLAVPGCAIAVLAAALLLRAPDTERGHVSSSTKPDKGSATLIESGVERSRDGTGSQPDLGHGSQQEFKKFHSVLTDSYYEWSPKFSGTKEEVEQLSRLYQEADMPVERSQLIGLAIQGQTEYTIAWLIRLARESESIREVRKACEALSRREISRKFMDMDKVRKELLEELCQGTHQGARAEHLASLAVSGRVSPEWRSDALQRLSQSPLIYARMFAAENLTPRGEELKRLEGLWRHDQDAQVRAVAVRTILRDSEPEGVWSTALAAFARKGDLVVRKAAVCELGVGAICGNETARSLLNRVEALDSNSEIQLLARSLLASIPSK